MLTIQLNDVRLEQQLVQQAEATGKTTQQFVKSLLAEVLLHRTPAPLSFPRLDPG